ncbi:GspE/PulE family protein, partial [Caenispirillum salinarum]|uniref:GspE/PulE family protein n=1 Tax=Caenispirillum salinarum TaxID=859058 RepID=UPI001F46E7DD
PPPDPPPAAAPARAAAAAAAAPQDEPEPQPQPQPQAKRFDTAAKGRPKSAPRPATEAAPKPAPADQGGGKPPVRLGDKLVERGLISKDQLAVALQEKKNSPKMMGELLVDLGFITEQALSAVLAEDSGFERFDPQGSMVDPELLKMIPLEIANRYRVFPSTVQDKTARLAMADIYDVLALDQVKRYLPPDWEIQPLVCSDTEIQQAIDQYYGHELSIDGILRELDSLREGDLDTAALDDTSGGYTHPVVRLVNAILLDAVKSKASDIHFEPEGNFLRVRYRIDGMMMQVRTIHKQHWGAFSHRMKIMSGMNIADRLNPQDGRFSLSMANKRIDFRVSSLPTVHGENLVLRILDKSSAQVSMRDLGYSQHNFEMLTRMVKRPEGIIIVTGPTGSGKTTTLYAIMNYINSLDLNIMTLEDPVEFELSLIRQSQIREGSQMTFADGIRTLMRQDPDVILVGEVRDGDTAGMAVRAAMTGHQVYTTLHTNDAAGAIPRLQDLGLRPSLMAGNIIGVVAQRLGRKLCEDCRTFKTATEDECRILGVDPADPPQIGQAVGCDKCRGTGYRGRVGVSEILPFNDTIDEMIIADAPLSHIREQARQFGFIPMVEDGIGKVLDGIMDITALTKAVNITDRL